MISFSSSNFVHFFSLIVSWFKEGQNLVSSPDFEIVQDGEDYSLRIPEVFDEDAGRYSVKAENEAGEVFSQADLTVRPALSREPSEDPSKKRVKTTLTAALQQPLASEEAPKPTVQATFVPILPSKLMPEEGPPVFKTVFTFFFH